MKIAFVANKTWNIYNFRKGIVQSCLDAGYQVVVIAPTDETTVHLERTGCQCVNVSIDSKGGNPWKDMVLMYRLYQLYKLHQPDFVFHFTIKPNIYGSLAAGMQGIRSAVTVSGLGTAFLHRSFKTWLAKCLYRLALRFSKCAIFQNEADRSIFVNKKLTSVYKTHCVPGSGVNIQHYAYEPFVRHEPFHFLLIARLIKDKGVYEFVEAVKSLRAKGIHVHGSLLGLTAFDDPLGVPANLLEMWVQEGYIQYLGHTDDVRPFIQSADCVVLPSYREGTPRTLLEAAAMGKPVLATRVPGCEEVVEDGYNGLLCSVKDVVDLASKMESMFYFSDEKLRLMGKNGRLKIEQQFDEKRVINYYMQII